VLALVLCVEDQVIWADFGRLGRILRGENAGVWEVDVRADSRGGNMSEGASTPTAKGGSDGGLNNRDRNGNNSTHEVFGDVNLGAMMLFLLLLHLLNYSMRDPCTC